MNKNGTIDDSHAGHYQTRVQGRIASRLVRSYHRSPKPFFLYWAPIAPHFGLPREPDDPDVTWPDSGGRGADQDTGPAARGPGCLRPRDPAGLRPAAGRRPRQRDVRRQPAADRLPPSSAQPSRRRAPLTRQRAEALLVLDQQIGRLVRTLEADRRVRPHRLMFTSDNGYFLGEHRLRQGKIKAHEPSLRVPFLVAGPGDPARPALRPDQPPRTSPRRCSTSAAREPPHPARRRSVGRPSRRTGLAAAGADRGPGDRRGVPRRGHPADPPPDFTDARTTIGSARPGGSTSGTSTGTGSSTTSTADANELHNGSAGPPTPRCRPSSSRSGPRTRTVAARPARLRCRPTSRRTPTGCGRRRRSSRGRSRRATATPAEFDRPTARLVGG